MGILGTRYVIALMVGTLLLVACTRDSGTIIDREPVETSGQPDVETSEAILRAIWAGDDGPDSVPQPTLEQEGEEIPTDATRILWMRPKPGESDSFNIVSGGEPIKGWYRWGDRLVEVRDPLLARQRVRALNDAEPQALVFLYAITGMSQDAQQATVLSSFYCGPLCGEGRRYTLRRDREGNWTVTDHQQEWIS